jgi:hypothetical protein
MEGGMSSMSIIGTVRVSSVKFRSIRTRALSASAGVGFPAAAPLAAAAEVSGRGRRLFRAKFAGRTGPTSAKQQEVHPSKLCYPKKKNMIYIEKDIKITYTNKKHSIGGDLPISPRSSPGGTGISGSLEKSIPAYG